MSSASTPRITYYVVLLPQDVDASVSLRPLSRLLEADEERLHEVLETETYEVVARFAKKANGQGLQSQLTALGVRSLLISDQDIRGHVILSVATASMGAGGLAFRDFEDKPLFCPFEDVVGVLMMDVVYEDGVPTTLVDIHRRSTNITLRLDRSLFDFAQVMNSPGAGLEEFLGHLVEKTGATLDAVFQSNVEHLTKAARDFGSRPIDLAPPPEKVHGTCLRDHLVAANLYSFVRSTEARA